MSRIPVVDRRQPSFTDDFLAACGDVGFVAIEGHGIDPSLFAAMRDLTVRLFATDDATKRKAAITRDNYRGFIPLGLFTPNRSEISGTAADLYEGYKLHWECPPGHPVAGDCALYGPNLWADHVPDMAAVVRRYWTACDTLGDDLLDLIAGALGQDRATFRRWFDEPLTNMTLLHYPAAGPADHDGTAFHAHKDTNVLTFLHPDPVGGLEVRSCDGRWLTVDCPPDALVVNIGEMLELWSGGQFVATPHRVASPTTGSDRYTFPFFIVPRHDVVVAPLLPCREDFAPTSMPVGPLSAEVWRTNWPDEAPAGAVHDLGSLDRTLRRK